MLWHVDSPCALESLWPLTFWLRPFTTFNNSASATSPQEVFLFAASCTTPHLPSTPITSAVHRDCFTLMDTSWHLILWSCLLTATLRRQTWASYIATWYLHLPDQSPRRTLQPHWKGPYQALLNNPPKNSERVTGRKARGLQTEEIGCKCQTFFSLS